MRATNDFTVPDNLLGLAGADERSTAVTRWPKRVEAFARARSLAASWALPPSSLNAAFEPPAASGATAVKQQSAPAGAAAWP